MDLDYVLGELGELNTYQLTVYFLLFFPLIFASMGSMNYVFTTGDLDYRCKIPECETNDSSFEKTWLSSALPYKDGKLESHCKRYKSIDNNFHDNCTDNIFIRSQIEECRSFVFKNKERSAIYEFELLCEENDWKRTLFGTLHNIGEFIGLPLAGLFSDRFGRKTMITGAVLSSAIIGTMKSFSMDYAMLVLCEVADAIALSGIYTGGFILGVEITGPSKRSLAGVIMASYYSIGEIILGVIVWLVYDWRTYLRIIYLPGFIILICCWIMPESMRWLMLHGKQKKVIKNLERLSSMNKKPINDDIRKELENLVNPKNMDDEKSKQPIKEMKPASGMKELFKSKIMLFRTLNCSFIWIINAFVYYGLSLCSVVIGGNKYFNFVLVSFIEIPGYITTWLVVDAFGRKSSLAVSLLVSSCACILFHFFSVDMEVARLIVYLVGKCAITVAFTSLYVLASEFFPTNLRHSLMGICSTLGRFGSMIAPQMPIMATLVDPMLVFGLAALVAGLLAFCFPETLHCKLPDTIAEAEIVGKDK